MESRAAINSVIGRYHGSSYSNGKRSVEMNWILKISKLVKHDCNRNRTLILFSSIFLQKWRGSLRDKRQTTNFTSSCGKCRKLKVWGLTHNVRSNSFFLISIKYSLKHLIVFESILFVEIPFSVWNEVGTKWVHISKLDRTKVQANNSWQYIKT